MLFNLVGKTTMTTEKAFRHFVKNVYPTISPKPEQLRVAVSRFNKKKYLSEERQIAILEENGYKATAFIQIPSKWAAPK